MDAIRFDALTKPWTAATSQRRKLAGVLAGALVGLGLVHAEDATAAKSGTCKKKCGQCEVCKKGKCKRKNGKKHCKKGTCEPAEGRTPCNGDANCVCDRAIEGDAFCSDFAAVLCVEGKCANSGVCGAGERCVRCGGTGATACVPVCGAA